MTSCTLDSDCTSPELCCNGTCATTAACLDGRCCSADCVISGSSPLTKLVNKISPTYYNDGTDIALDNGTAAGSPRTDVIPLNMTITIGGIPKIDRAAGFIDIPIADSSLHYEFEEGLKVTETETTVTIFFPGKIIINQEIDLTAAGATVLTCQQIIRK